MLTDIRFKLLAFLPIAAGVTAALAKENLAAIGLPLSIFGLVVTLGLVTYNTRNDQLYDELVGRAAAIERSLDIPDGAFANRPKPWLTIRFPRVKWKIDHGTALSTIYAASIALWLFGVVAYVLEYGRRAYLAMGLPSIVVRDPSAWVNFIAVIIAIIVTLLGSRFISRQEKTRSQDMKRLAACAVRKAIGRSMSQVAGDQELIKVCAKLSGSAETKVRARAKFYAAAPPERVRYYVLQEAEDLSACHLIALLTDLPPDWIFNCYTDRKGFMPKDRPINVAHRGASAQAPENTLEAFRLAVEAGAGGLALDVRMTLDREIIVIRDATVDRTTNGSGRVADMKLDDIRRFDAGHHFSLDGGCTHPCRGKKFRIPTLAEVYEWFPDTSINIEIRAAQQGVEEAVLKVVRDAGAEEHSFVVSNHDAVVKRFRKLADGQVSTGASRREVKRFCNMSRWRLERIVRPEYEALQVPVKHEETSLVNSRFVKAAHAREVRVDVWTTNQADEICYLLNLGVDVIMTDRPDVVAELLPGDE
jgi:glycerophosphoryl diester phosphodiesterase